MEWLNPAAKGVAFLAGELGPHGQWPGIVCPDGAADRGIRDIAPPLTALGVLALRGLLLDGVEDLVKRSLPHITKTELPGGLWRYYANIPPDTDDSALCALALRPEYPLVSLRTACSLVARRLPDGRFPTWFEPGWEPVVAAVTNAHAVALIGPGPETDAAVAWLLEVVASGTEVPSSAYYPDPLDLHLALTRAVESGVVALRPAVALAARNAADRLRRGNLAPYRIAQAVLVADGGSRLPERLRSDAARQLADQVQSDGGWPADTLFVARRSEGEGFWHYQSRAVVTALCLRALVTAAGQEEK